MALGGRPSARPVRDRLRAPDRLGRPAQAQAGAARPFAPILVLAALAAAAIEWPELLGNGKDVLQPAYNGGERDPRVSGVGLLFGVTVAQATATALCLRVGAPGGLFTPTMKCSALLGEGLRRAWSRISPGNSPDAYAVVGSAARLAAATGDPISAVLAALELDQHISGLIALIVVAACGACIVMADQRRADYLHPQDQAAERSAQRPFAEGHPTTHPSRLTIDR